MSVAIIDNPPILRFVVIFNAKPAVRNFIAIGLFAVVLGFIAFQIVTDIQYRFVRNEPRWNFERLASLDEQLTEAAPHDGLFLSFEGFDPGDSTTSRIYNYALYKLYPKPVLVGDPSQLARGPAEVLAANAPRDDQWLRARHIGSKLTIIDEGNGDFSTDIHWVQPPLPQPSITSSETRNGLAGTVYLLCCVVIGYAVVSTLIEPDSIWETFGLSAVLGPGIMGLCLIFLSMMGSSPSRLEIIFITPPFAAISLWRIFKTNNASPNFQPEKNSAGSKLLAAVALLAIAYGLLVSTLITLRDPVVEWDAFSIWQYKAKLLTLLPLRPQPADFSTICLSQTHLRYPILAPMMSAGQNAMAGGFDQFARAPSLLLLAGLAIAIYATINRVSGRLPALIATALMLNLTTMYHWAGSGTAEMALTAFYGCSIICLLRWQRTHRHGDLILTALFSACMVWSKNEGLALAAINLVVLLAPLLRQRWKSLLPATIFILIVASLFAPWQWYIHNLPRTDEDYAGRLSIHGILANAARLPAIVNGLRTELINGQHWGIFWLLLLILSLNTAIRYTSATGTLWLLLVLHVLAYVPPFMVTNWTIPDLMVATADRLFMHTLPAATLLIGMLMPTRLAADAASPVWD